MRHQNDRREGSRSRRNEKITIVNSPEDFLRVVAVRSVVYIGDQKCPYNEEFDGNDHCAMHLIGWVGDEPVGCLRIRFFANFGKVERLAVREEYRRSSIAFRLVRFSLNILARKGYRRAYGHARIGLEDFWGRFGAIKKPASEVFCLSGHNYVEMILDLPGNADAITLNAGPFVINRPEGAWDSPGVLEAAGKQKEDTSCSSPNDVSAPSTGPAWFGSETSRAWQAWFGYGTSET